jgi:hypothetical protein
MQSLPVDVRRGVQIDHRVGNFQPSTRHRFPTPLIVARIAAHHCTWAVRPLLSSGRLRPRLDAGRQLRGCIVVLCIVGTVHKSHVTAPVGLKDRFDYFGLRIQFGKVPSLKLCPLGRVMAKPLPKFSAGCDILKPGIKTQGGLLQTTRPQPLDEESNAIVLAGRVVSTL